jgi:hypothetical protein
MHQIKLYFEQALLRALFKPWKLGQKHEDQQIIRLKLDFKSD